MKKLLLFFAIALPLLGYTQTTPALPIPINGKWVYYNITGCFENFQNLDTMYIDNLPYLFSSYSMEYCDGTIEAGGCFTPGNYMRSEGNVWYRLGGMNSVFFDWDWQEGDTIWYDGMLMQNNQFIISNIDTITTIDNVQRRTYHFVFANDGLTVPYYYNSEVYFIEGIGCSVLGIDVVGIEDQLFLLTCFYNEDGLEIYHQDYPDYNIFGCCTISVEETTIPSFKLFPSPASDHTSIQFEAAHIPQSIQIFNATGQLMLTENVLGRLQMQVNISEYAKGIYTVRGRFENGEEVSEKLVVE
jgi:hypothetical protein